MCINEGVGADNLSLPQTVRVDAVVYKDCGGSAVSVCAQRSQVQIVRFRELCKVDFMNTKLQTQPHICPMNIYGYKLTDGGFPVAQW